MAGNIEEIQMLYLMLGHYIKMALGWNAIRSWRFTIWHRFSSFVYTHLLLKYMIDSCRNTIIILINKFKKTLTIFFFLCIYPSIDFFHLLSK